MKFSDRSDTMLVRVMLSYFTENSRKIDTSALLLSFQLFYGFMVLNDKRQYHILDEKNHYMWKKSLNLWGGRADNPSSNADIGRYADFLPFIFSIMKIN